MPELPAPRASGAVTSHGAQVYYEVFGPEEGRPLILLHGNSEDNRVFAAQIPYFAATRPVIGIEARGHGHSGLGVTPLTYQAMAVDVAAVIRELGIAPADVVGFSDGGNVGLWLAVAHADLLHRLVTSGANATVDGVKPWLTRTMRGALGVAKVFGRFSEKVSLARQRIALMVSEPGLTDELLKTITTPTLVMAGEKDAIAEAHTLHLAEVIPTSELVIVPGADHFILTKQPDLFNATVDRFLAR
jgi:pimeloyl-ACP methyl ester carboxylesterase